MYYAFYVSDNRVGSAELICYNSCLEHENLSEIYIGKHKICECQLFIVQDERHDNILVAGSISECSVKKSSYVIKR
jgi:hypothetical protein